MSEFTLGDFRKLTIGMPDSTPIYKTSYNDERYQCWVESESPLITRVRVGILGYNFARDPGDFSSILSDRSDAITAIVI